MGFYNPAATGTGLGLTPPWEGGEGKYSDQGILIIGGASSVGQYSKYLKLRFFYYPTFNSRHSNPTRQIIRI